MPNLGAFHPQVVHFVVASLFLGLPSEQYRENRAVTDRRAKLGR